MPFGKKPAGDGRIVNFDAVYEKLIKPAVEGAGLEPLRADEEMAGGVIHKAMFERLALCEYAVADLTTANANVFYQLGVRHSLRSWATQLLFAEGWGQLPFDVGFLRAIPYQLGAAGEPSDVARNAATLTPRLRSAPKANVDSPLYQLLEDFPDIARLKTDVFRDRIRYAEDMKAKLAVARQQGEKAVAGVEAELGDISHAEAAVVVDLFLSYRATKSWESMIVLVNHMAQPLAATVMVQEQLALALNRAGRSEEAERVLTRLIKSGVAVAKPTASWVGFIRIAGKKQPGLEKPGLQRVCLSRLFLRILRGSSPIGETLIRALMLLHSWSLGWRKSPRQSALLPVVRYSVERRIAQSLSDYWDFATLLELAVLDYNQVAGETALANALAHVRESWEPETTARNLGLIRQARSERGDSVLWADLAEKELLKRAGRQ